MKRKNSEIRTCMCGCPNELPDAYKGRIKLFFSSECRINWHKKHPGENARDNTKKPEPKYAA